MRAFFYLLALLALGCGSGTPKAVPVSVAPGDAHQLAGHWSGSYQGSSTGRHGSIVFNLSADSGTAHGDVMMVAEDRSVPMQPGDGPHINAPLVQPLSIQFVLVSGNDVSGVLDPYQDPNCHCLLSTTFAGRIEGDLISGQFVTWGGGTAGPQRGTWSVRRTSN